MRIAIIGGGFTGLAGAMEFQKMGCEVCVFESEENLGGLAGSFRLEGWKSDLEKFYHHGFTNDRDLIEMACEVGATYKTHRAVSGCVLGDTTWRLDSPWSVLRFGAIGLGERVRMGFGLFLLKLIRNGSFLEKWRAVRVLPKLLGKRGYEVVWKALLRGKFGKYAGRVNMAWFWARVAKRTAKLIYFDGGFGRLIEKMAEHICKKGGEIRLATKIGKVVDLHEKGVMVDGEKFDGVLITAPAKVCEKMVGKKLFPRRDYLWGQTMVVRLGLKLNDFYWLNILEKNWPFLVCVEQTNLVSCSEYGGETLVYLGNYLDGRQKQLKMTDEGLFELYWPFLQKIGKGKLQKDDVIGYSVFRAPYAQMVCRVNESRHIPKAKISKRVFMANMSMVYPYDRGVNYAIQMGRKNARALIDSLRNNE